MVLACVLAPNLAFTLVSSSATLNQLLAMAAWGLVLMSMGSSPVQWRGGPAVLALIVLWLAPWVSHFLLGLPLGMVLQYSAMIAAALLLLMLAQGLSAPQRRAWFVALCWGLLLAGLLASLVSLIQVFAPDWADDDWIARSDIAGRALGNLRQPNHLASILLWACVAAVCLAELGCLTWSRLGGRIERLSLGLLPLALMMLIFALVLSASRGGMALVVLLFAWGVMDRRLSRPSRWALGLSPLMLGMAWGLMALWSQSGEQEFGAAARLSEGAGSPKRMQYLASAWALLRMHPWTGVGWGEFNFALTMTPMPGRPNSFVDHTHNLPMQLLVELGWPVGLLVLGLLAMALWRAFNLSRGAHAVEGHIRRCALMLVLLILLQGLLEFQLWYAYFLLPAAFAFGITVAPLAASSDQAMPQAKSMHQNQVRRLPMLGLLMVVLSLAAFVDYLRVVAITVQPPNGMNLFDRIVQAQQRSILFSVQADYAAATYFLPGPEALDAARRNAHNISDESTMMAWANALLVSGDPDRARYVAQRLREFNLPRSQRWFSECEKLSPDGKSRPYQCDAPRRQYSYREMR